MTESTLEERLEARYIFLTGDEGCWRTVDSTININCMSKNHLKNSIKMIKEYGIDYRDKKKYKQEIEVKMKTKIKELETELSQYKDS